MTKDNLKVLSLKARSLRSKIEELQCLITTEDFDVVVITETFIDTGNNELIAEYNIDDLIFFNEDRVNRRGERVALYFKSSLQPVGHRTVI